MASRPELLAPPEIFYDDTEARKYTSSSRIIDIQVRRERELPLSFLLQNLHELDCVGVHEICWESPMRSFFLFV